MLTALTIFVLLAGIVLWNLMIIVPMRQACVLERFGNFRRVLEPGFHIVVPFLDKVAYRHEIREQVFDIPAQLCITRDNIQVAVDGVVYLKVMDAKRASYGIGNYQLASINLAQTTMRSEIGKLTLSDTFYERDKLNDSIVREIDEASDPWGIKVMRYEIKNISPSDQVVHTLEKQMEAEREKRADITLAMAQKESKILISEGHRQEAINISEGEKQKRINEAQGRASEIKILAEASAEGLQQVAHAIKQPGGDMAVKMRLVEDFIGRVGEVMKGADVSVLPTDLAHIKGLLSALNQNLPLTQNSGK
ncbi:SPFH domain-containing protein [Methylomarinum sp. Ch1-1]|uniref:SPFH domain-containing protein n=1 Tax=Methylomarinum roseum TaxID=3067653 RepID=A0AAU7NR92_9GAMM|nr:slipin family protein [Methylomarinum sp. Ch1-1]MDP4520516.1 SPFH domain-containing protein [Methylomarinum sp. Ch1-1]